MKLLFFTQVFFPNSLVLLTSQTYLEFFIDTTLGNKVKNLNIKNIVNYKNLYTVNVKIYYNRKFPSGIEKGSKLEEIYEVQANIVF